MVIGYGEKHSTRKQESSLYIQGFYILHCDVHLVIPGNTELLLSCICLKEKKKKYIAPCLRFNEVYLWVHLAYLAASELPILKLG